MRSIGFYSFKGGVGRTNLLLNIAYYLASEEDKDVGLMDLDLEAPGLTVLPCLEPTFSVRKGAAQKGEYPDKGIWDFLSAATRAMDGEKKMEVPDITEIFYETKLGQGWKGSVHLAPAWSKLFAGAYSPHGKPGKSETLFQKLLSEWKNGKSIGEIMFKYVRNTIEKKEFPVSKISDTERTRNLDYLLVDLRTGLTELADTAIGALFSELVIVSGLNKQNIDGMKMALSTLADRIKAKEIGYIRVIPVFSPIPNAELDKVREKLKAAFKDLKELEKELRQDESQIHLVLPGFDENREKAPAFATIHYCDYLAVGDGVILEEYPETLAAKEILKIAESIHKPSDIIEKATEPKEEEKSDTVPIDPCWKWSYKFWTQIPDWRWPAQIFGQGDFDDNILLSRLPDNINKEAKDNILSGIAMSISLSKNEKIKILRQIGELEEKKQAQLLNIFLEEQAKLAGMGEPSFRMTALAAINQMRNWLDLLQTLGVRFVASKDMIDRVFQNKTAEMIMPEWAWLLLLSGLSESSVATASAKALLASGKTPKDVGYVLLDTISLHNIIDNTDFKKAVETWIDGILDTDKPAAWFHNLATDLMEKFQIHNKAEAVFQKAISEWNEDDKRLAFSWNGLGNLLKNHLGRLEEAEIAYRKAIEIDPKYAYPWNGLGNLLQDHLGRLEEAEPAYRKAIEIDPKNAYPWNGLGNLLKDHLGRFEEAEMAYRKAIEIDPKFAYPWNGLGNLLKDHLGRFEEADMAYKKAIEIGTKGAGYALYNKLEYIVLSQNQKKIQAALDEIDKFLNSEKEFTANPDLMDAVLLGIVGRTEALKATLSHLENRLFTLEDRVWAWICASMTEDGDGKLILPEYTGTGLSAAGLESITGLAMVAGRRMNKGDLKKLKGWIKQALADFQPPAGSRALKKEIISPRLKILCIKEPTDA